MKFVLILFALTTGPGPHGDVGVAAASFKNEAACILALETAAEQSGGTVGGFCTPTKVK